MHVSILGSGRQLPDDGSKPCTCMPSSRPPALERGNAERNRASLSLHRITSHNTSGSFVHFRVLRGEHRLQVCKSVGQNALAGPRQIEARERLPATGELSVLFTTGSPGFLFTQLQQADSLIIATTPSCTAGQSYPAHPRPATETMPAAGRGARSMTKSDIAQGKLRKTQPPTPKEA